MMTDKPILTKGEQVNLSQEAGEQVTNPIVAAGWDIARRDVDLDLSAIITDEQGNVLDVAYFGRLTSNDGSLVHSGDNLTGAGDGDDETIKADRSKLNPQAKHIFYTITSYSGQSLDIVKNAFTRVVNNGQELARFELNTFTGTGALMARLTVNGAGFDFKALGVPAPANSKTLQDLFPILKDHVA